MPRDGTANRTRILDAAEVLVKQHGFAGTSVDQVLTAAGTSKGAFFHHFSSKLDMARALSERYAAADVGQLRLALEATADLTDPVERVIAFVRHFEDQGDAIMAETSACLYTAVLTEQGLLTEETTGPITRAVVEWREQIAALLHAAAADRGVDLEDVDALADHVFVTFEGAFLLCRAAGDPEHMRRQLGALRVLLSGLLQAA